MRLRANGLFAIAISSLFFFFAGREVYRGLAEIIAFQTVDGTITSYVAPDKNATDDDLVPGRIRYEYFVLGNRHEGRYPPKYDSSMPRAPYALFARPWKIGDRTDVSYSPTNPAVSTLEPRTEPMAFVFLTFAAPFFFVSVAITFGRPSATHSRDVGNGTELAGGSVRWVAYFVLSTIGAIAIAVVSNYVTWQTASVIGALTPTVLVPSCVLGLDYWAGHFSRRKNLRANVVERSRRRQTVALGLATLFWWSFVGVFLYQMLGGVALSLIAQYRYQPTPGRVIESRLKEIPPSGEGDASYRPIVIYTYSVANKEYRGDRILCGPGTRSWGKDVAECIRRQYPTGAQVAVHYDPTNPQLAALDTAFLRYDAFNLFFLFPFVVIGIFLLVQFVRMAWYQPGSPPWLRHSTSRAGRTFQAWFVSQAVSIIALGLAGAYHPNRAWMVWIGIGAVAAATSIATLIGGPSAASADNTAAR